MDFQKKSILGFYSALDKVVPLTDSGRPEGGGAAGHPESACCK
jgi:hypothetical protein